MNLFFKYLSGDFIKFHTVYKDGSEIVEEYSLAAEEIVSRKVKKIKMTGKEEWTIEIGDTLAQPKKEEDFLIKENDNNVNKFLKFYICFFLILTYSKSLYL